MKRPGYREAIEWVARNDSAGDDNALDAWEAGSLTTAIMLAHLYDVDSDRVGRDIVRKRRALIKNGEL